MRSRHLAIYSAIFSIVLIAPYLSLTGYDTIGFDSGGEGELIVGSAPSSIPPTIEIEVPTTTTTTTTTGGGGGLSNLFSIEPSSFQINLTTNTNIQKTIKITNLINSSLKIDLAQEGLDGMIIFPGSVNLSARETKDVNVTFVALSQPGNFMGKLKIGPKIILVSMDVREKLLLFDSNIVILNKDYLVKQGRELKTEVTLIPLGDKDRLDVTLNYVIKDFEGKIFLTKSETLLIDDKKTFKLNFDTGLLPLGDYVIGLELVYPNGVATSTASFKVVEKLPFGLGSLVYYLLLSILVCAALIIGLLLQEATREKEIQGQYVVL